MLRLLTKSLKELITMMNNRIRILLAVAILFAAVLTLTACQDKKAEYLRVEINAENPDEPLLITSPLSGYYETDSGSDELYSGFSEYLKDKKGEFAIKDEQVRKAAAEALENCDVYVHIPSDGCKTVRYRILVYDGGKTFIAETLFVPSGYEAKDEAIPYQDCFKIMSEPENTVYAQTSETFKIEKEIDGKAVTFCGKYDESGKEQVTSVSFDTDSGRALIVPPEEFIHDVDYYCNELDRGFYNVSSVNICENIESD